MPASLRIGLAVAHTALLPQLAELVGRIMKASPSTVAKARSDVLVTDIADLRSMIPKLTTEVVKLRRGAGNGSHPSNSASTLRRDISRRTSGPLNARATFPSSGPPDGRPCFCRRRDGASARKTLFSLFLVLGKGPGRLLGAANYISPLRSRLVDVWDHIAGPLFLVDSSGDITIVLAPSPDRGV